MAQEDGGGIGEFGGGFGGQEAAIASLCQTRIHFGMAVQIVGQTCSHIFPLRKQSDSGRQERFDLFDQQRIVRATQDKRIDLRIGSQNMFQMFPDEIVRSR